MAAFNGQDRPPRGRNPSGGIRRPGSSDDGSGPDGQPRLWLGLLILLALLALPRIFGPRDQRVPYGRFVELVDGGQIKKVTFEVDRIMGEGQKDVYSTGRLEALEKDLVSKLGEKKIPFDAISTQSWLVGDLVVPADRDLLPVRVVAVPSRRHGHRWRRHELRQEPGAGRR